MIYLLFGEDTYRLNKRLKDILESHRGEGGDFNISQITEKHDFQKIKAEAEAIPFLSDKRLLIVKNIFKTKDKTIQESLTKWLKEMPETTDLVFVEEGSPDQRTSLYKTIVKLGKVETFSQLKSFETVKWIQKKTEEIGGKIDTDAATTLQIYCNNDLSRLENEIQKLLSFDAHITKTNVEKLVDAGFFNTIFDLSDAISEHRAKKGLEILQKMLDTGENEQYLVTMLARQIRNLLIIKDLSNHRLNEEEIIRKTRLNPYVVKKTLSQTRNFSTARLLELHSKLIDLDVALKTTSNDPKLLLQTFIAEMSLRQ